MQDPKLDHPTVLQIAAKAGVSLESARKYAFADPTEKISRRSGAEKVRAAVVEAARALGVRA